MASARTETSNRPVRRLALSGIESGDTVEARVHSLIPGGAILHLLGLPVHMTALLPGGECEAGPKAVEVGDRFMVRVVSTSTTGSRYRIFVSRRGLLTPPDWTKAALFSPPGSLITGRVKKLHNGGALVVPDDYPTIAGIIQAADMPYALNPGEEVVCKVALCSAQKQRMHLRLA